MDYTKIGYEALGQLIGERQFWDAWKNVPETMPRDFSIEAFKDYKENAKNQIFAYADNADGEKAPGIFRIVVMPLHDDGIHLLDFEYTGISENIIHIGFTDYAEAHVMPVSFDNDDLTCQKYAKSIFTIFRDCFSEADRTKLMKDFASI